MVIKDIFRFAPVVSLALILGAIMGFGYYQLSWSLLQDSKTKEKATILRLTDAFVTTYSGVRSSAFNKEAPVPATYRAHSIEAFNRNAPRGDAISVVMVGFPGRSIKTEPLDEQMAENIRTFVNASNPAPTSVITKNANGPVLRTLYPSIAKKQSCVTCHNEIQSPRVKWALNDVMGAFAIDAPVGVALAKLQREAFIVGLIIFLLTSIAGVYLQNDINRRKASVVTLTNAKNTAETALERAEGAERTKSEFLANMSHEIRTPMNGVMGMAELLSATNLDEKQKKFTDVIVSSSASLLKIINDILDFSRMDAQQLVLESKSFNLAAEVDDVATLISKTAQEKGLELAVRIEPGLPERFNGDAGRIRQVILNLVGNAVKFTKSGIVLVDVSNDEKTDVEGDIHPVTITVRDTGEGIPKDKLEMIFGQFQQVDGSSTRQHDGTGLGLAISKRLVEIMGGEIGVDSAIGFGSTFWIKIPLEIDRTYQEQNEGQHELSAKNVLIIDDNEVNRSILHEQLGAQKILTQSATSGVEGLEQLRAAQLTGQPVDLVILDYHMPNMNGADVVRTIRADEKIKNTPILLLTSVYHSAEFDDIAVDAQMAKPVSNSMLLSTMAAIFQKTPLPTPKPENIAVEKEQAERLARPQETPVDQHASSPSLPINQAPTPPVSESPAQPLSEKKPEQVPILIVDDNETNLILLREILSNSDLECVSAHDGAEAIALVEKVLPRIILMDVSMPGINGLDATRTIRQLEREKGIPRPVIIGQTGHALDGDKQKCLDAGMDDYITKPISAIDLISRIEQCLKTQRSSTETHSSGQSALPDSVNTAI